MNYESFLASRQGRNQLMGVQSSSRDVTSQAATVSDLIKNVGRRLSRFRFSKQPTLNLRTAKTL